MTLPVAKITCATPNPIPYSAIAVPYSLVLSLVTSTFGTGGTTITAWEWSLDPADLPPGSTAHLSATDGQTVTVLDINTPGGVLVFARVKDDSPGGGRWSEGRSIRIDPAVAPYLFYPPTTAFYEIKVENQHGLQLPARKGLGWHEAMWDVINLVADIANLTGLGENGYFDDVYEKTPGHSIEFHDDVSLGGSGPDNGPINVVGIGTFSFTLVNPGDAFEVDVAGGGDPYFQVVRGGSGMIGPHRVQVNQEFRVETILPRFDPDGPADEGVFVDGVQMFDGSVTVFDQDCEVRTNRIIATSQNPGYNGLLIQADDTLTIQAGEGSIGMFADDLIDISADGDIEITAGDNLTLMAGFSTGLAFDAGLDEITMNATLFKLGFTVLEVGSISEAIAAAGVTVDGLLIKDGKADRHRLGFFYTTTAEDTQGVNTDFEQTFAPQITIPSNTFALNDHVTLCALVDIPVSPVPPHDPTFRLKYGSVEFVSASLSPVIGAQHRCILIFQGRVTAIGSSLNFSGIRKGAEIFGDDDYKVRDDIFYNRTFGSGAASNTAQNVVLSVQFSDSDPDNSATLRSLWVAIDRAS